MSVDVDWRPHALSATMAMTTIPSNEKTQIQRKKESERYKRNSEIERCNDKIVNSLCWANYDNTRPLKNETFMYVYLCNVYHSMWHQRETYFVF